MPRVGGRDEGTRGAGPAGPPPLPPPPPPPHAPLPGIEGALPSPSHARALPLQEWQASRQLLDSDLAKFASDVPAGEQLLVLLATGALSPGMLQYLSASLGAQGGGRWGAHRHAALLARAAAPACASEHAAWSAACFSTVAGNRQRPAPTPPPRPGEGGLRRLARSVDAGVRSAHSLLADRLAPTLEQLAFRLGEVGGAGAGLGRCSGSWTSACWVQP